ncbi:MAG TPA: L-aspartate oxidase, partial [Pseudohongiella sp.]|nr:L-aspartate oxidase [Pseudohongiella sp.]
GANRMASNSLLECFVLAFGAAEHIRSHFDTIEPLPERIPAWDESRVTQSQEEVVVAHNWDELRRVMWDYVGIVRSDQRLLRAQRRIQILEHEISYHYRHYVVSRDLLELRNLVLVSRLIVESALLRKESRGLHYTLDYPELLPEAVDTILAPQES